MEDIIHLLPETVANQIAAGEVVQRPCSVIKELVENSIDAGATDIKIIIKAAGKTLIQVIDNGKGMSRTDAFTAFQRHATSKIASADDLTRLQTMGFRGEALASIAAVAQVELKTRRPEDEVGTRLVINGGEVEDAQQETCPVGSNFMIKNLFYNVPARRRFLKNDNIEFSHLERDFFRIALVYPEIAFELYHNDKMCYSLPASLLKERITNIYGNSIGAQLMSIKAESSIVSIKGFVGKPDKARKRNDRQYFFVNGRYMNSPYFNKAVMQAYERLLPEGTSPDYFIYMAVDPQTIDVNVHPTKTEIKFENDMHIFPILTSAIRESLGKMNAPIDFDEDVNGADAVFAPKIGVPIVPPTIDIDPTYNPFAETPDQPSYAQVWDIYKQRTPSPRQRTMDFGGGGGNQQGGARRQTSGEIILPDIDSNFENLTLPRYIADALLPDAHPMQVLCRYIVVAVYNGMLIIDQKRAHTRVLYEKYIDDLKSQSAASQLCMFQNTLELTPSQVETVESIMPALKAIGYDLQLISKDVYAINGVPSNQVDGDNVNYLLNIIDAVQNGAVVATDDLNERIAISLAKSAAVPYGKRMGESEMKDLIKRLFASSAYSITPEGKKTYTLAGEDMLKGMIE